MEHRTYRLIASIAATFAAVLVSTLTVINTLTVVGHDYFAMYEAKHRRLENLTDPKIIIVGGSNATFGYASEVFQNELGMQAVNMALHANFGLRFMLSEVQSEVDSGDVVIISPEYEQFAQNMIEGDLLLGEIVLTNLDALQYLDRVEQYLKVFSAVPITAQKAVISNLNPNRDLDPMYLANAFNRYGDIEISSDRAELEYHRIPRYAEEDLNPAAIGLLKVFSDAVAARGARCVLTYPSIPKSFYAMNTAFLEAVDAKLRTITRLEVVNTPIERIHPDSHCYDTHYHLRTKQMRRESTRKVARDILKNGGGNCTAQIGTAESSDTRLNNGKPSR